MSASEHNFTSDVLISGEELRGYSAANDLTLREPVGLSGDYEVDASTDGEADFIGVALYDAAAGTQVDIAGDDCEVEIEVSEAVTPGDELVPDGTGSFRLADNTNNGETGVALAQTSAGAGELCEAYIHAIGGATL